MGNRIVSTAFILDHEGRGLMLGFCAAACGQLASGRFNGHVFDQNGAVVPGATVTLQDVQTSLSRSTKTRSTKAKR